MSFRIEEKLFIKPENLLQFREFLAQNSAKKIYSDRTIQSLYFDNLNLDMYRDSIEGSVPRKKIRIRQYPHSEDKNFYLEIKTSSVEGRFKKRQIIDNKEFNEFKTQGIFDNQYGLCFPNYHVSYLREYALIDDVRISIDTGIKYKNFQTNISYNDDKIIVENQCSLISTGTESYVVNFGKAGWINKARQQPDRVKDVLNKIKSSGFNETFRAIKTKLDYPMVMGYSAVGTVAHSNEKFSLSKGDRVFTNSVHQELQRPQFRTARVGGWPALSIARPETVVHSNQPPRGCCQHSKAPVHRLRR